MKWAKDALEGGTGATNYIKDLDQRLRKAARALAPDLTDMISTPAPPTAAPTGPGGPSASDIEATASHMAKTISEAAGQAIAEAKAQISAEAKKAADAAAARTAQMIADLPAVSPALQKNAPPAPAPAPPAPPANGTNATLLEVRFRRLRRRSSRITRV